MKKQTFWMYVMICLCPFVACESVDKEKPLLRVFDNYLYPSDIEGLVKGNISEEDSIAIVDNYINQWIQQMVVLDKAKNIKELHGIF